MKISELPLEVKEKALEYQKPHLPTIKEKELDEINAAFIWGDTKEGSDYWGEWHHKKADLTLIAVRDLRNLNPDNDEFCRVFDEFIKEK